MKVLGFIGLERVSQAQLHPISFDNCILLITPGPNDPISYLLHDVNLVSAQGTCHGIVVIVSRSQKRISSLGELIMKKKLKRKGNLPCVISLRSNSRARARRSIGTVIQNNEVNNLQNATIVQKAITKSSVGQHRPPTHVKVGSGA
jgi:hypothetical protein